MTDCIIIHTEILYVVMMSSIMAAASRLPRLLKKHLKELLYFKLSVQVQASASQLEIKRTKSLKHWEGGKKEKVKGAERWRKKNVAHYVLFPNGGHDSICRIMKAELDWGNPSVLLACKTVSDQRRARKTATNPYHYGYVIVSMLYLLKDASHKRKLLWCLRCFNHEDWCCRRAGFPRQKILQTCACVVRPSECSVRSLHSDTGALIDTFCSRWCFITENIAAYCAFQRGSFRESRLFRLGWKILNKFNCLHPPSEMTWCALLHN